MRPATTAAPIRRPRRPGAASAFERARRCDLVEKTRPTVTRTPRWPRSRTARSRPGIVPRSRHASPPRRSPPIDSPSTSGRSRWRGAPRPRSRRRPGCARASSGSDGRAPRPSSAASSRSAPPRPPYRPSPSRRPQFVRAPRGERLHAALGATNPAPRASGEATLTKTPRLAGRTRPHRASPPRGRAPLSGLAAHRRRRARGNPQRGPAAHTLGRRIAERPPDADHHPRAGRRRSGPHRRDDARRNDRH
jgi:hypothetical protein